MLTILLALGSAAAYGVADFSGGLAARGAHVLRVVAISAPASLALALIILPFLGGHWSPAAVWWGMAAGLASAAAFVLLYQSLSVGPMSVVSPITAVVSAALPVLVGLLQGERLHLTGWIGIALAAAAITVISMPARSGNARLTAPAFGLAIGAGAAIASQLILLHQTPTDSGVVPLVAGRAVSGAAVMTAFLLTRRALPTARPNLRLAATAGVVDALANLAFLLAVRHGQLTIVAVIAALYPAATVLLARGFLHERLAARQWIGLAAATLAVTLFAAA